MPDAERRRTATLTIALRTENAFDVALEQGTFGTPPEHEALRAAATARTWK